MSSGGARPTLDEARARLRELGYLRGSVERYVFRRALEGGSAVFVAVLAAGAVAVSLAETAAVASSQFRYGGSARGIALLFLELAVVAILPGGLFASVLSLAAVRSRRPGRDASLFALFAAAGVLAVWLVGVWRLGPERPAPALLWGVPVAAGALILGATIRAAFLARVFARSGRLPDRPRRALLAAAAIGAFAIAAILFLRPEPGLPAAPLPSPRPEAVVVVAIDGLRIDEPEPHKTTIAALLGQGRTGFWWPARMGSPAEIWTNLATGVPASRHGVRALAWVRPYGLPPLRPPFGTGWYFRGVGLALGSVSRAAVSAWERRSLAFWEVAASAGVPPLAVGWWASGPWPGATVVENREVLARSSSGLDADAVAIAEFERAAPGKSVATVYLPSADILRDDPSARPAALARLAELLERLVARARTGEIALIVLTAESHPTPQSLGRMTVFDGSMPPHLVRIRPEDVAPSVLARAGIPVARDLAGRPAPSLFRPGSLETATVERYGDRVAPSTARGRETDREYLERLKSLGYLN